MPEAEQPAPPPTGEAKKSLKSRLVPAFILLGVMGLEGVGIVMAMRILGSSPDVSLAEDDAGSGGALGGHRSHVEMDIAELDAFNSLSGRLNVYHIKVSALVEASKQELFAELIAARRNTISDRIQTIIRGAEPQQLSEAGLNILKRQIMFEIGRILGDESLVKELLIPQLLQSRSSL